MSANHVCLAVHGFYSAVILSLFLNNQHNFIQDHHSILNLCSKLDDTQQCILALQTSCCHLPVWCMLPAALASPAPPAGYLAQWRAALLQHVQLDSLRPTGTGVGLHTGLSKEGNTVVTLLRGQQAFLFQFRQDKSGRIPQSHIEWDYTHTKASWVAIAHLPPLGRHPVQVGVREWWLGFNLPLRQHVMSDDGNPFLASTLLYSQSPIDLWTLHSYINWFTIW